MAMSGNAADARTAMAAARAGLAELQLRGIALYLALLDGFAEMLAGDPEAAERAIIEVEASAAESGDRWYMAMGYIERALTILAQRTRADAADAVARVDTLPTPCDGEWIIKRHTARALLAAQQGDHERGLADARAAVVAADSSRLVLTCANAHRTHAELLRATGRTAEAAAAVRRALELDEAKANVVAAARTRERFAELL
jgi:tetratricopeptide (TPR) repeat protein